MSTSTFIEVMSDFGFLQTISRTTRITEYSATLIDHIYTNSLNSIIKTSVVTLDMSDHLGTVVTLALSKTFDRTMHCQTRHVNTENEYYFSRKFNAASDEKFLQLIADENWESVTQDNDAETKYDNFIEIYTQHYNTAYVEKKRQKRQNERANPKPWIIPWLEDACNRKNNLYHQFVENPTVENKTKYANPNLIAGAFINQIDIRKKTIIDKNN